jgi:hypothetical protein
LQLRLGSFGSPEQAAAWLLDHFRYVAWGLPLSLPELAGLIDLQSPRLSMQRLLARYIEHTHPQKTHADVWIDHTPDNFKYHSMLKWLFPEARFIHIVRDGRAVCNSIKNLHWGPNNAYAASRHWATRLQEALSVEVAEAENCLRVRFEDLLTEPTKTMQKVCAFIDVPFDRNMLNGGGLQLPVFTRQQHDLVGKPPQSSRKDNWRQSLSDAELRDFESYPLSHTMLKTLGYEPTHPAPPKLSMGRTLGCYCHDFSRYLVNRLHHRRLERRTLSKHRDLIKGCCEKTSPKRSADVTASTPQHN